MGDCGADGGWEVGTNVSEVVDTAGACGVSEVVLEASLGPGSVLQSGHVHAVVLCDMDVVRPGGGTRAKVEVDHVAGVAVAVRVEDHVLAGVVSADDGGAVAGAAGNHHGVCETGTDGVAGAGDGRAGGGHALISEGQVGELELDPADVLGGRADGVGARRVGGDRVRDEVSVVLPRSVSALQFAD